MERELILGIHMKSTDHAQAINTFETRRVARTTAVPDFVDVTDDVSAALDQSGIKEGRAVVFAPGSSCTIIVNERETGLLADLEKTIERLKLSNGNRSRTILGSSSVVLPVLNGKLKLGIWQRVLLVELSEASERYVDIQIVGQA